MTQIFSSPLIFSLVQEFALDPNLTTTSAQNMKRSRRFVEMYLDKYMKNIIFKEFKDMHQKVSAFEYETIFSKFVPNWNEYVARCWGKIDRTILDNTQPMSLLDIDELDFEHYSYSGGISYHLTRCIWCDLEPLNGVMVEQLGHDHRFREEIDQDPPPIRYRLMCIDCYEKELKEKIKNIKF